MKYYYNPASSNCRKVDAVLAHTGLDPERCLVDLGQGEQHRPDFLALNPNGMVPAIVDGAVKLWESNAIMAYLCSQAKSDLWPVSEARYDILRWMFWELAHFGPAANAVVFERMIKPSIRMGDPDQAKIADALERFARFGRVLDEQLADRAWVTGDTLTIADYAIAADLMYAEPAGLDLAPLSHVVRWRSRLSDLPAWKATEPKR